MVKHDPSVDENLLSDSERVKGQEIELVTPMGDWEIVQNADAIEVVQLKNEVKGKIFCINGVEFDTAKKENKRHELS